MSTYRDSKSSVGDVNNEKSGRWIQEPELQKSDSNLIRYGKSTFGCESFGVPVIDVVYNNLSYVVQTDAVSSSKPSIAKSVLQLVVPPKNKVNIHALNSVSGRLQAGTSTLIISAPGGGATTFLRMLSGRTDVPGGQGLYFNGSTPADLARQGISLQRLVGYIPEQDIHEPLLTVTETLKFASDVSVSKSTVTQALKTPCTCKSRSGSPCMCAPWTPEYVIDSLGLSEAKDTIIGDNLIRGVSGGQKKRVGTGEALVSNARILCADSITGGLDSKTAELVVKQLISWSHNTGGILVANLQQPSPDILHAFDNVLLLTEGMILYQGPTSKVEEYLLSIGYCVPGFMDLADFLSELVVDPEGARTVSNEYRQEVGCICADSSEGKTVTFGDRQRQVTACEIDRLKKVPCPWLYSARDLARHWRQSESFKTLMGDSVPTVTEPQQEKKTPLCIDTINYDFEGSARVKHKRGGDLDVNAGIYPMKGLQGGIVLNTEFAKKQYSLAEPTSLGNQLKSLITRQGKLIMRNKVLILARLLSSIAMGLMLGSLFWGPAKDNYQIKFGLALFSCIFIGFTNNAEVPASIHSRSVVFRHTVAGYYGTLSYVLCVVLSSIPVTLLADVIYSLFLYFMTGWTVAFDRWLVFLLSLFSIDMIMAGYIRTVSYAMPTLELASMASMGIMGFWMLTAGYYVIKSQMPSWLSWITYTSPYFWAVTTITNNEFHSERYQELVSTSDGRTITSGELYSSTFDYPYSKWYQWGGMILVFGFWALIVLVPTPLSLRYLRYDVFPGSKRVVMGDAETLKLTAENSPSSDASVDTISELPTKVAPSLTDSQKSASVIPCTLAFQDLKYTIPVKGKGRRTLLDNVEGVMKPGTMTALMGATGAGKTTLLNVLSFRTTQGERTGHIELNGQACDRRTINSMTAYAEQEDVHYPTSTVREALEFSMRLRTNDPTGTLLTTANVRKSVQEVLEMLELAGDAERLVKTLSAGERKRLTIGVELVSNPSILFLDEPTTGLNSHAAAGVANVLRKVASTGRTIICTIHQPSAEIFFFFDQLLLLAPGGRQVYFGPTGHHSQKIVDYFEAVPGVTPLPKAVNPATWMLHVLATTDSSRPLTVNASKSVKSVLQIADDSNKKSLPEDHFVMSNPMSTATELAVEIDESELDETALQKREKSFQLFAKAYQVSALHKANSADISRFIQQKPMGNNNNRIEIPGTDLSKPELKEYLEPVVMKSAMARSFIVQFWEVYRRCNIDYWRNSELFLARLIMNVFLALLFGFLFLDNDTLTYQGTSSLLGLLLGIVFPNMAFMSSSINVQMERRPVFYRERTANNYYAPAYSLSVFLVELPHVIIVSLIGSSITYFMSGLKNDVASFFFYCLVALIVGLFFMGLGVLFAAMMPSLGVAHVMSGMAIAMCFVFAGLFRPLPQIPAGWKGLSYAIPTTHMIRSMAIEQFYCRGSGPSRTGPSIGEGDNYGPTCPTIEVVGENMQVMEMDRFQFVQSFLDLPTEDRFQWGEVGWTALAGVVVMFTAVVSLQYFKFQTK